MAADLDHGRFRRTFECQPLRRKHLAGGVQRTLDVMLLTKLSVLCRSRHFRHPAASRAQEELLVGLERIVVHVAGQADHAPPSLVAPKCLFSTSYAAPMALRCEPIVLAETCTRVFSGGTQR